ncbi:MAG: Protein PhlB [Wolbachia endosymbiont of Ctenocephalides orientis wCori]|nr:MAG: Protein PhlB [Wolbachia endosymbiont of Ctenocephalides orientis wCori]
MNETEQKQLNKQLFDIFFVNETVDEDKAKELIKLGANVNQRNTDLMTLLHVTAAIGSLDLVKFFMEHGANINVLNKDRDSPALTAAKKGSFDNARYLIEEVSNRNKEYTALLYCAVEKENYDFAEFLVKRGANTDRTTILHVAAENGHTDKLKILIDEGANVNAVNKSGRTPLHIAVCKSYLEIVKYLTEKGADVNAADKYRITPLHFAAQGGYIDIVKFLLEKGADVNAVNECVYRASDVYYASNEYGNNPLHWAVKSGHIDTARLLLENGADISTFNERERTPLHIAAEGNRTAIVKLLLESVAYPSAAGECGITALRQAARGGYVNTVNALMPAVAVYDSIVALYWSAKKVHTECSKVLTEKETDDRVISLWSAKGVHAECSKILIRHILIQDLKQDLEIEKPNFMHDYKVKGQNVRYSKKWLSNYWDECQAEITKMQKENKPLYDFVKENNIDRLISMWEEKKSMQDQLNDQENLKSKYPNYADILISKTKEVREEILLNSNSELTNLSVKKFNATKYNSLNLI